MNILKRTGYQPLHSEYKNAKGHAFLTKIGGLVACVTLMAFAVTTFTNPSSSKTDGGFGLQQTLPLASDRKTRNIRITSGRLLGTVLTSRDGREYSAFYNIPYATPPIGDLRFEPPRKFAGSWRGTRDARIHGLPCMQSHATSTRKLEGSEDCLYLTVFTPSSFRGAELLPVMVYFLGGAFIGGKAFIYGGDYFMDEDVVVVLPEFRVGALGNLATGDSLIPGNMGSKDQVMALRWVQENIRRFGGNTRNVTIFGNSSGAMVIHGHLYSPMSRGLFHRAICQSGSMIAPDAVAIDPRRDAESLALNAGCPANVTTSTMTLVDCLKSLDAEAIVSAPSRAKLGTGLTVEPPGGDEGSIFLPDVPLNLLLQGRIQSDVPWIVGVNMNESVVQTADLFNETFNWDAMAPELLQLDVNDATFANVSNAAKGFYFGGSGLTTRDTRRQLVDLASDRMWVHPSYTAAILYALKSKSPVYLYWLTHEPEFGRGRMSLEGWLDPPFGVAHADEVSFLFPFNKFPFIEKDSKDYRFSKAMVRMWAGYSRGNAYFGSEWESVTREAAEEGGRSVKWLELKDEPKMWMVESLSARMAFWDQFPLEWLYVTDVVVSDKK